MAKRTPTEIMAQQETWPVEKTAGKGEEELPAMSPTQSGQAPQATKTEVVEPLPEPEATPSPAKSETAPSPAASINRREFLNYAWLASISLCAAQTVGLSLWFALPNFKEGQFGGQFPVGQAADVLPEVNDPPNSFNDGKFWLVSLDVQDNGEAKKGALALFKTCTHLGCLCEWSDITGRFECPCHGSKFEMTGDCIDGPAPRGLDRFAISAHAPDGSVKSSHDGSPLVVDDDDVLIVDTGNKIS